MKPISFPGDIVVPTEVWVKILSCLFVPIPPALSCPDRSLLRQQALTVTARVCKLFNSISVDLLYKSVVTDRLDLFLGDCDSPRRQRLLQRTRYLYIEYREERNYISYSSLLGGEIYGIWDHVSEVEMEKVYVKRRMGAILECQTETFALSDALYCAIRVGAGRLFPRLDTIAVSSIYGRQSDCSVRCADYTETNKRTDPMSDIQVCHKSWGEFIANSKIRHICTRNMAGPLVLNSIPRIRLTRADIEMMVHFNQKVDAVSIIPEFKTSWSSDTRLSGAWQPTYRALNTYLKQMGEVYRGSDILLLDIYCSTEQLGEPAKNPTTSLSIIAGDIPGVSDSPLSLETQRAIAARVGEIQQASMRKKTGIKDILRWHCSADAPVCKACGSGPPA